MTAKQQVDLPSLREVTEMIRSTYAAFLHPECGGGIVYLTCVCAGYDDAHWSLECFPEDWPHTQHGESVPGMPSPRFDAVAAARRLLSAAKDDGLGC
jgi:hypothetical protein